MKKAAYICLLLCVVLVSCDHFVAPLKEIGNDRYTPKVDGYIDHTQERFYNSEMKVASTTVPLDTSLVLLYFEVDGIPAGARVLNADLTLKCTEGSIDIVEVSVQKIAKNWEQNDIQLADLTPDFADTKTDSAVEIITPDSAGRDIVWDVTEIVQSWVNDKENFGLMLLTTFEDTVWFSTSEGEKKPSLSVRYD